MTKDAMVEFGERLVLYVRDEAIQGGDLRGSSHCQSIPAGRWRTAAAAAGGQVPANMVIADVVDSTLSAVLYEIDSQERLHLLFCTSGEETVDMTAAGGGELAGWCGGAGGWRTWYSKERIVDAADFAPIFVEYGVGDLADDPAPNLDELDMRRRAIEELGILLMRHVRDVAIQSCDMQLLPHSETPVAKRWRRAAIPFNGQVPPQVLIPDCVDEAIYAFLRAIDQGLLPLSYVAENGETVDLVKEGRGELAARYMAPDGWRAKYSKERIGDDNPPA